MSISYWQNALQKNLISNVTNNYDVCIIGAGIAGLSTAYWLEKNDPTIKIAILDKYHLGAGASGRNAGFVTCGSAEHFQKLMSSFGLDKAIEIWRFSEINRELVLKEIIQDDFISVDFKKTGSCTVAAESSDWIRYQSLARVMLSSGLDVELIDEAYLARHYGVNGFAGAIQYLHDGVIHPIKLLEKIKSKLKNTDFIFDQEQIQIKKNPHSYTVQTQKLNIECQKVFSCLNGFTSQVLSDYKNLIKPQRGQIMLTEPLPSFVKGPCYLTKHLCYFRQLLTGELLVGGFRNHDLEAENTDKEVVTDKIQNAIEEFTRNYFQGTKNIKISHRWSGIMGFTPDGQMLIGEHPHHPNMYLMGGCSGHGMGLSFHAAKTLVECAYGKPVPTHLQIQRFET